MSSSYTITLNFKRIYETMKRLKTNISNYPKNIKISAEYVARAKGLTLEKVVDVTMDNASQLLRIQTLF
ncbi:MAG: hypothetical protein QXK39_04150 [Nitrososphaerota archaeon]